MFRRHRFVKQIRLKKYRKSHRQLIENQPICSICLTEFERDVFLKELRCGHFFHSECIDPWLLNEKAVCPVCRRGIYDVDEWNAIEIGLNQDIDCVLHRFEQQSTNTFSGLFSFVFCLFVVGYPVCLILMN